MSLRDEMLNYPFRFCRVSIIFVAGKLLCLTCFLGPGTPGGTFRGDRGARAGVQRAATKVVGFSGSR